MALAPWNLSLLLVLVFWAVPARAALRWQSIFDGRTLAGWHQIGKGSWTIEKGIIHGTHDKAEKEFGHLVTDKVYSNFVVRVKYKAIKGNSGLYFRIEETGFSGVSGLQAEIDPEKDAGGLYETNGRGWVVQPKPEDVKKWYRPNDWNTMVVTARGGNLTVHVNGKKSAEVKNDPGRASGRIALQLHGGQEGDVYFKDIDLADLDAQPLARPEFEIEQFISPTQPPARK